MTKDRTSTIKITRWIERAGLVGALIMALIGATVGNVNIVFTGIVMFLLLVPLFILEALWTHELQLEEIKENTKR